MELRVLREGSKTRIKLGSCCPDWLYNEWAVGEETAYLRKSAKVEQEQGKQRHPQQ